jgi:hypothetical protein
MKMYGAVNVYIHIFLTSALVGGKWSASFTPRPLYPGGKNPRYPLYRRLGGPQNRSGNEKNLALTGT